MYVLWQLMTKQKHKIMTKFELDPNKQAFKNYKSYMIFSLKIVFK